jgi:hypothetical protein
MITPNLFTNTLRLFKPLLSKDIISNKPKYFIGSTIMLFAGHATYAYGTQQKERIFIEKKYDIVGNGNTSFMITANNKEYSIPYSLWYWQYDVPEKFNAIEVAKEYNVKYYGFRFAPFGIFPNIVDINDINDINDI